jgi:hypothetical protein
VVQFVSCASDETRTRSRQRQTGQLQVLERYRELRRRKRRPEDQQRFEAIVAAVVSDAIHHHLLGSPGAGLVVTRSKKLLAKRSR